MKYIPLPEMDLVSNALNFSTPDCHVVGGCEIYITKASKGDKKLYKDIEANLESQYESLVRLSASLSPPYLPASEDGKEGDKNGRSRREHTVEAPEIDLSRASPFGPLSQVTARRTFAYLIATLNASHTDYDFSHALRPRDFRKERSLRAMMHDIDLTLQNLRPRQTAAVKSLPPMMLSKSGGLASEVWNQNMWKLIEAEMVLRDCERYKLVPDQDPFDGEDGALWSMHYFFFNKAKKRVCYMHLRGFSVISHSPTNAPVFSSRPMNIRSASDSAKMYASYWLGNDVHGRSICASSYADDDETADYDDDEIEVPYISLDEVRSDLMVDRFGYPDLDDDYDDSWKYGGRVREVNEDIFDELEMDA